LANEVEYLFGLVVVETVVWPLAAKKFLPQRRAADLRAGGGNWDRPNVSSVG
jgi:hypothetical protein